jgi:hypothetical protein
LKIISAIVLVLAMTFTVGCAKTPATAPIPGQINAFDATTFRALMDAQAAINSFKADLASGKLTETPGIKTALNQVITDYDTANVLYQAYHAAAGTTPQPPVQAAVTQLQTDVNALGGVK